MGRKKEVKKEQTFKNKVDAKVINFFSKIRY